MYESTFPIVSLFWNHNSGRVFWWKFRVCIEICFKYEIHTGFGKFNIIKIHYPINNFILIACWNENILNKIYPTCVFLLLFNGATIKLKRTYMTYFYFYQTVHASVWSGIFSERGPRAKVAQPETYIILIPWKEIGSLGINSRSHKRAAGIWTYDSKARFSFNIRLRPRPPLAAPAESYAIRVVLLEPPSLNAKSALPPTFFKTCQATEPASPRDSVFSLYIMKVTP